MIKKVHKGYKYNENRKGLKDYDMVYFSFVGDNFDPKPEQVTIKIEGPAAFDEHVKMWGFGFEGDIYNEEGAIVTRSNGEVNEAIVMLRFPKGSFNSRLQLDQNFVDFAKKAVKNSDRDESNNGVYDDSGESSGIIPLVMAVFIGVFGVLIAAVALIAGADAGEYGLLNKKELVKPKKLKDQYYRDIPYDGPIEDTYLISTYAYPAENNLENYLNALMLKWIYEGVISIGEVEEERIFKNAQVLYIILNKRPINASEVENGYFDILEASMKYADDEKLKQKHVEKYLEKHDEEMEAYLKSLSKNSMLTLEKGGYINNDRKKKKVNFGDEPYKNRLTITQAGIGLYENFIKFKNYLKDYSLIEERAVEEVKLWDEYMIYAAIYGISQEVYENFTAIYPDTPK